MGLGPIAAIYRSRLLDHDRVQGLGMRYCVLGRSMRNPLVSLAATWGHVDLLLQQTLHRPILEKERFRGHNIGYTYIYIYARGVCARVFAYKQTHTHEHQDQALKEYALWGKG
jgi:hypothetical protein